MAKTLLSQQELLLLVRSKTKAGAEALYDQYAMVFRLSIFRITGDTQLTETLLEKTILTIWNTADHYNEQQLPLLAWMLNIAKGLAHESLPVKLVA